VAPGELYEFAIDLRRNTVERRKADSCSCEFPTINYSTNGKPYRFAYLMAAESGRPAVPYQEIIKWDRERRERQVWSARSEGGVLGEPVFVPRPNSGSAAEDDGWVIAQMYLTRQHRTQYVVLDARQLARGPIARVQLREHLPYGFHSTFTEQTFV